MRKWRIEDSAELYNISGWGLKYFSINDKGHVQVTPREGYASVDLKDLMDALVRAQDRYASYGIATVQEGMFMDAMLPLYQAMLAQKILKLDVVGCCRVQI